MEANRRKRYAEAERPEGTGPRTVQYQNEQFGNQSANNGDSGEGDEYYFGSTRFLRV